MPLYEYHCDACGHRFEIIQKFSDPPVTACRRCGAAVRKLVSSPAFQFKGSGWYVTDYAKKADVAKGETKAEGGESKEAVKGTKDGPAKESATKEAGSKDSASTGTGKP